MNGAQEMVPNLSHDLNGHFQRQVSSQCLFSIVRYTGLDLMQVQVSCVNH